MKSGFFLSLGLGLGLLKKLIRQLNSFLKQWAVVHLDYPVVFLSNKKVKRGYYQLSAHIITENPKKLNDGEITELHVKQLEKDINSQPFNWLWSHKRWKHKKPILDTN
jgi:lauroyl/myristoyl acyltransferase